MTTPPRFDDWQAAPNLADNPEIYELENEALQRDGRLDVALYSIAPWDGQVLLDIGCGSGFWLPRYAERAEQVIGVEPDQQLLDLASRRVRSLRTIDVRHGSAEHLPVDECSVDLVHARFAYFFGAGAERGLNEVARVLKPGGVFLAVDNSWSDGDFARLLRASTVGNATIDPDETRRWWEQRGARRHEVEGGWTAKSSDELERVLRIEFPSEVVTDFVENHQGSSLTYRFAVCEWHPRT